MFSFRLKGATEAWSLPLILRLLGPRHDPRRALREQTIQNAVADLGYPAPRVLTASADPAILGGGFLVMARVPGRPMLEARWIGIAALLVESQLRLHALDVAPLLAAMDAIGERAAVTLDGLLARFRDRVAQRSLDGLGPAMDWLTTHRPPATDRPVICHGDFHPQNILVAGGVVTGVLDWPNVVIADAAYDVASTRIILGLVPLHLSAVPLALRGLAHLARRLMLARYLAGYRRRRPIDAGTLRYHEALASMRQLLRVSESRADVARDGAGLTPLDVSSFGERVAARFAALTAVTPRLPRVPG